MFGDRYQHYFIAVEPQLDVVENFTIVQQDLLKLVEDRGARLRLVEPEHCHMTLRFLDHLEDQTVLWIKDLMDQIARSTSPFKVTNGALGAFPNAQHSRILYVDLLAGRDAIVDLAEKLESRLSELAAITRETRVFRPHLTLGRVKSAKKPLDLRDVVKALAEVSIGSSMIDELVLFRSRLDFNGVNYDVIHRTRLKG